MSSQGAESKGGTLDRVVPLVSEGKVYYGIMEEIQEEEEEDQGNKSCQGGASVNVTHVLRKRTYIFPSNVHMICISKIILSKFDCSKTTLSMFV